MCNFENLQHLESPSATRPRIYSGAGAALITVMGSIHGCLRVVQSPGPAVTVPTVPAQDEVDYRQQVFQPPSYLISNQQNAHTCRQPVCNQAFPIYFLYA